MGGELFLAAVGGCFMSNLLAAINARESDVSDVRTEGDRHAGGFARPVRRDRTSRYRRNRK
jgi:organic hydroperoxide reductase OsmC/OhrA